MESPSSVDVRSAPALFGETLASSNFVPIQGSPRAAKLDRQWAEFARLLSEMRARFSNVPPEEIERETEKVLGGIVVPAGDVGGGAENPEDDLALATVFTGDVPHLVDGARGLLERNGYLGETSTPANVRLVLEDEDTTGGRRFQQAG